MEKFNKVEILKTPEKFLSNEKKFLKEKIECIELSHDDVNEIIKEESIKIIRDKVLGLFKLTDIINTALKWNEEVKEKSKKIKQEILLSKYFEKNDENEIAINKLKNFITDPKGNTLFNKTLRILDNNPPDKELFFHLANALNHIIDTDFISMFESHKYVLNQIENISPQGLTILADYKT